MKHFLVVTDEDCGLLVQGLERLQLDADGFLQERCQELVEDIHTSRPTEELFTLCTALLAKYREAQETVRSEFETYNQPYPDLDQEVKDLAQQFTDALNE